MSAKKKASKKKLRLNTDNILKIIIVFCVALIIVFLISPSKETTTSSNVSGDLIAAEPIENNTVYSQTIISEYDYIKGFKLLLSTYGVRNESGTLSVVVETEDETLYNDVLDLYNILDNSYVYIEIEKGDLLGKYITISFYYDDYEEGNSLTYWYVNASEDDLNMVINDEETDTVMTITTVAEEDTYFTVWYFFVIIAVCGASLAVGGKDEK